MRGINITPSEIAGADKLCVLNAGTCRKMQPISGEIKSQTILKIYIMIKNIGLFKSCSNLSSARECVLLFYTFTKAFIFRIEFSMY